MAACRHVLISRVSRFASSKFSSRRGFWPCVRPLSCVRTPSRIRRASLIGRHFCVPMSASRSGKAGIPRIFPTAVVTATIAITTTVIRRCVSVSIMAVETKPAFIVRSLFLSCSISLSAFLPRSPSPSRPSSSSPPFLLPVTRTRVRVLFLS